MGKAFSQSVSTVGQRLSMATGHGKPSCSGVLAGKAGYDRCLRKRASSYSSARRCHPGFFVQVLPSGFFHQEFLSGLAAKGHWEAVELDGDKIRLSEIGGDLADDAQRQPVVGEKP